SSIVSKPSVADCTSLPPASIRRAAVLASVKKRSISSTTNFTSFIFNLLSDIRLEIRDQPFEIGEGIRLLAVAIVPVIAFSGFIVVAYDPLARAAIEQRVLQPVRPFRRGFRKKPDTYLDNRAARQQKFAILDKRCFLKHM